MAEHKWTLKQLQTSGAANSTLSLTTFPQGTTATTRVGDTITGTSVEMMAFFSIPLPDDSADNIVYRWIGFIWKDDTTPTMGDILDPIYLTLSNYNIVLCPFSSDKKIKRKILYSDHWASYHEYDGTTVSEIGGKMMFVKKVVIPLSKLRRSLNIVNFDPTGENPNNAINHIYYLWITSDLAAAVPGAVLQMVAKYNFIDM